MTGATLAWVGKEALAWVGKEALAWVLPLTYVS